MRAPSGVGGDRGGGLLCRRPRASTAGAVDALVTALPGCSGSGIQVGSTTRGARRVVSSDMPSLQRHLRAIATVDLRALALARIVMGLALLIDWTERVESRAALYAPDGILPIASHPWHGTLQAAFSPALWTDASWWMPMWLALAGVAYLLLALGAFPRVTTVVAWVCVCVVRDRNPLVGFGFDTVATLTLFSFMFLPVGARFGVHARRIAAKLDGATAVVSPAVLIHVAAFAAMYGFTALLKAAHAPWRDGSALVIILGADQTARAFGRFMLDFPLLLQLGTWGTLVVESFMALAVLTAHGYARVAAVLCALALHAGIQAMIPIGVFGLGSIAQAIAFTPSSTLDRLFRTTAATTKTLVRWTRGQLVAAGAVVVSCAIWSACWFGVPKHDKLPAPFVFAMQALHLDQNWGMFTAIETWSTHWIEVEVDGVVVAQQPVLPERDKAPPLGGLRWYYWLCALSFDGGVTQHDLDTLAYLHRTFGGRHVKLVSHEIFVRHEDGGRGERRSEVLAEADF